MSNKTILKNAAKYFFSVIFTMHMVQFAGSTLTMKNDFANIMGATIYFALLMAWFFMIKHDVSVIRQRMSVK